MPNKEMPKEVSIMGGCPMFGMSSHLLNLAEIEAEGKAKAARLRAQQRGRVATRKKGRLKRFLLRCLWGTEGPKVRCPTCGSRYRVQVYRAAQTRRSERDGESSDALRQMPPTQKAR